MRIAILGWGSLIWDPRQLKKEKGDWHSDGPSLPIEFARISRGGRLTLVLYKNADAISTLWVMSLSENIEEAIDNLREREETSTRHIGFIIKDEKESLNTVPSVLAAIKSWAEDKQLDAVIWTDLSSTFEPTEENVRNHIRWLCQKQLEDAEVYVRKAPKQVRTRVRSFLEKEYGWTPIE